MNAPWSRIFAYPVGGGLFLTWFEPPDGALRFFLIGGMIIAFGYLDGILTRRAASSNGGRVVSLRAFRARQKKRSGSAGARERRILRPVFSSAYHGEVETLLQLLRAEGMSPMMVTQNRKETRDSPFYMVMLPESEIERARPLINRYAAETAKRPS